MSATVKGKRIGVLMGGLSAEREISLRTGAGVLAALRRRGHDAFPLDWKVEEELDALVKSSGATEIWNALHGTYGEDGYVQQRLEDLAIPYTGSGPEASAAAMDKVRSKRLFEQEGIPTPPWRAAEAAGGEGSASVRDMAEQAVRSFGLPLVVKPASEGSTVGVTIVHERGDLEGAIVEAAKYHGATLFERFIPGREVTAAILGRSTLGTVEIRPKSGFYDYRAKYLSGDTEYLVPAPLEGDLLDTIHDIAARAHEALGCSGYSRVDLRVTAEGEPFVLEVNTLPGLTETSLFPKVARHAGIDYDELVERILDTASLKR